MLSEPTIRRCYEQRDHERMLKAVADNGTPMPLPLRARLGSDPAAGVALGLRRLVELTYGPTPLSRDMTHTLLALQRPDGGWGGTVEREAWSVERETQPGLPGLPGATPAPESAKGGIAPPHGNIEGHGLLAWNTTPASKASGGDPLATACAVAALSRVHSQQPAARDPELAGAIDRGLRALADLQRDDALFEADDDRDDAARTLAAAFILFLLAGHAGFRGVVRFSDLMTRFDEQADRLDRATEQLIAIARLDDRPLPVPSESTPALAA